MDIATKFVYWDVLVLASLHGNKGANFGDI